jgi:ABC-type lipoprotein export system ATPase subunit
MISISNLAYTYTGASTLVFRDFAMQAGDQVLLLGESGSGKTTLLHLLGGLLKSQLGAILVNGANITQLSESSLDHFRGKHYGFIFQRNHLINALSVEKNLLMAPFLAGLKQDKERVEEVLTQLGIADKKQAAIRELSLGQAQRVAIARAILNKPTVILADEPTSALDDRNCDRVSELLFSVAEKNQATLVIATHDQRLKNKIKNVIQLG